jgi:hypothetical protein
MTARRWSRFFFLAAVVCLINIPPPTCADDKKEKSEPAKGLDELRFTAFDGKAPRFWREVRTRTTQIMEVNG